jgi:hypothetical protein
MRRNAGRFWARLGRRGCFLTFLALLDLVYAISLYSPPAEASRNGSLAFIAELAPLWLWALAWLIPGVLCLVQAWMRSDKLAFAAAIAIKVVWGVVYILAGAVGHVQRAYVGAAVWLAFALVVGLISTWPEPTGPTPARHRGD